MIFSKEEQTIVGHWRFLHQIKDKLENISLASFQVAIHFHPGYPQPNTLTYNSLRELVE